ncbi:MAG: nucleotidyltransferase domain-containing protein [bacterium]
MIPLIEQNRETIGELCRRYGVERLEVFGSAADDTFDIEHSDIDFIVEFLPGQDLGPWLAHYHDLRDELERLLGRDIDLVMAGAPKNPWFLRELNRTRKVLYAA